MVRAACVLLFWCSSAVGCATVQHAQNVAAHQPQSVQVVPAQDPRTQALEHALVRVPFGHAADGTAVVKDFLASASKQGAVYVTDISIHLVRTLPDGHEDCATRVYPVRTDITNEQRVVEPGRAQSRSVLKPVTR